MQTLESPEQLTYIRHVETRAVIADEINGFIVFRFRSKFDLRVLPFGGEFPGIVQEVFQNGLQKAWVTTCFQIRSNLEVYSALRLGALKFRGDVLHKSTQVHRYQFHRCACHLGEIQQRSEEHTSELQSHSDLVCRLL